MRSENAPQFRDRTLRLGASAHEHIDGRKRGFGPGMNREMRFAQKHDPGDALLRTEGVEMAAEHLRAGLLGSLPKQALERLCIAQQARLDAMEVSKQVCPRCADLRIHL